MTTATETSELQALALSGDLAQLAERPKKKGTKKGYPTGEKFIAQPKHNGWRIISHVYEVQTGIDDDNVPIMEKRVSLYSRSGNSYSDQLPHISAELAERFPAGTWLDGEAVSVTIDETGKVFDEWNLAQSVLTTLGGHAAADRITYMVFDLIAHRGIDARPLPYANRRALLESIFENDDFEKLALSPQLEATTENVQMIIAHGYEGAMIKRLNARYGSGKREGAGWTKVKPNITIEGVVMGWNPGENGYTGMVGSLIFGQHDGNGELVERGNVSGFDMKTRLDATHNFEKNWKGKVIEIGLVASLGGAGNPPQFRNLRPDRTPESVVTDDGE